MVYRATISMAILASMFITFAGFSYPVKAFATEKKSIISDKIHDGEVKAMKGVWFF